ncbi:TAF5-like RNA polymerase II p300/CBP-associated factor-associated factor 65 kDa subunit 5L [Macrosteles quadrilineatus]|uniref:TAF5-like RNA polymerase II p300/CBP-associated factor-associated factor 65 kDa subunit 5L n=1 Tax=Macrosteles quadrilineatus TaxID=74068 RepID=UPI0023E09545|nr:TAF5-like RNA polymerase II p300/CBP-associated factor-associated factor 65 kDa subunit 5L [Macrosteles quadrilineatus]
MTLAAAVEKDASRLNSIIFSTISNDITLAEQQFTKLKSWIVDLPEGKCKHELQMMLFPLLCHLYLEILRGGLDRQATSKFLKRHQELFLANENYRDIIEELSTVFTTQDIDSKPLIKAFRSCKYQMKISTTTMAALKKYLATQSHVILLQVLQTWFDIEVQTSESVLESDDDMADISSDENADYLESLYQQSHDDKEMRHLQEAIKLVRASPTPPPPLLLYTLNNSESACCARVSRSGKLMATGYSSSLLKLWTLSESKINPGSTHYSTVPLATNTPPQDHFVQEQRWSSLRGHCGPVQGVEFLHDADVLLSVSHDSSMRAWKLSDYSCAAIYRGHNYAVWCVAVSSLGVYIATGSHDRTARLWSLDRTYPLRMFAGHCQDVNCVQFHPNSSYVATGSADRSVRLWSVTDGSLVRVYGGHSGSVLTLAFSPNGQHLASAGEDKKVKVWDLASGGVLAELRGHSQPVTALDWSKDNNILKSVPLDMSVWEDKKVKVWDLASGGVLAELRGHSQPVTALDWSKDSNILASASLDGSVILWNSSLHFKPVQSENAEPPAKYSTICSSILNLQCLPRGNLVAVGTQ